MNALYKACYIVLFWHLLASVQCVLKVPDHTTRRLERTGSLHERVDSLLIACMNVVLRTWFTNVASPITAHPILEEPICTTTSVKHCVH